MSRGHTGPTSPRRVGTRQWSEGLHDRGACGRAQHGCTPGTRRRAAVATAQGVAPPGPRPRTGWARPRRGRPGGAAPRWGRDRAAQGRPRPRCGAATSRGGPRRGATTSRGGRRAGAVERCARYHEAMRRVGAAASGRAAPSVRPGRYCAEASRASRCWCARGPSNHSVPSEGRAESQRCPAEGRT